MARVSACARVVALGRIGLVNSRYQSQKVSQMKLVERVGRLVEAEGFERRGRPRGAVAPARAAIQRLTVSFAVRRVEARRPARSRSSRQKRAAFHSLVAKLR